MALIAYAKLPPPLPGARLLELLLLSVPAILWIFLALPIYNWVATGKLLLAM
jgi:hypothetical protein